MGFVGDRDASLEEKRHQMAHALNIKNKTSDGFIKEIEAKLDHLNIPKSLSEIGVPLDCSSRIADKAMLDSAASTNPVAGDASDLRNLIEQAIKKAR